LDSAHFQPAESTARRGLRGGPAAESRHRSAVACEATPPLANGKVSLPTIDEALDNGAGQLGTTEGRAPRGVPPGTGRAGL
jgi:hypothetical protein